MWYDTVISERPLMPLANIVFGHRQSQPRLPNILQQQKTRYSSFETTILNCFQVFSHTALARSLFPHGSELYWAPQANPSVSAVWQTFSRATQVEGRKQDYFFS